MTAEAVPQRSSLPADCCLRMPNQNHQPSCRPSSWRSSESAQWRYSCPEAPVWSRNVTEMERTANESASSEYSSHRIGIRWRNARYSACPVASEAPGTPRRARSAGSRRLGGRAPKVSRRAPSVTHACAEAPTHVPEFPRPKQHQEREHDQADERIEVLPGLMPPGTPTPLAKEGHRYTPGAGGSV